MKTLLLVIPLFTLLFINKASAYSTFSLPVQGLEINPPDKLLVNRVGRGITPPPSHTTVHALAYGGFFRLFNF